VYWQRMTILAMAASSKANSISLGNERPEFWFLGADAT